MKRCNYCTFKQIEHDTAVISEGKVVTRPKPKAGCYDGVDIIAIHPSGKETWVMWLAALPDVCVCIDRAMGYRAT